MQTMTGLPAGNQDHRIEQNLLGQRVYDYTEPCPYLPGREARLQGVFAVSVADQTYRVLLDHSFRRSGQFFYRPACANCTECRPIRVPVASFAASKSQRRCWKKNAHLRVEIAPPHFTQEKWELYVAYQREKHAREYETDVSSLADFLYNPVVTAMEFCYREPGGKLVAVGICDVIDDVLSTVYCYYDATDRRRGLGIYTALYELEYAKQQQLAYYYMGYLVNGCQAMFYKASFRPCEVLDEFGAWRRQSDNVLLPSE